MFTSIYLHLNSGDYIRFDRLLLLEVYFFLEKIGIISLVSARIHICQYRIIRDFSAVLTNNHFPQEN